MKDVLRAYTAIAKQLAAESFHWATLIFWVSADKVKDPGKPPALPDILRD